MECGWKEREREGNINDAKGEKTHAVKSEEKKEHTNLYLMLFYFFVVRLCIIHTGIFIIFIFEFVYNFTNSL